MGLVPELASSVEELRVVPGEGDQAPGPLRPARQGPQREVLRRKH